MECVSGVGASEAKVCTLICAGAKIHNWRALRRQLLKYIVCVAAGFSDSCSIPMKSSRGASNSATEREIRLYWISLIVFHASTSPGRQSRRRTASYTAPYRYCGAACCNHNYRRTHRSRRAAGWREVYALREPASQCQNYYMCANAMVTAKFKTKIRGIQVFGAKSHK